MVKEEDGEAGEEDLLFQEEMIAHMLEELKEVPQKKELTGIREEGRVLIFNHSDPPKRGDGFSQGGSKFENYFLGDIVGRPGRKLVKALLPELVQQYAPDLTVVNGGECCGWFWADHGCGQ